jgi:hypothetical protein
MATVGQPSLGPSASNTHDRPLGGDLVTTLDRPWFVPRHRAPDGRIDLSAIERRRIDQERAARAIVVLAATDSLPASRELYRRLLTAGSLNPALPPTVLAAELVTA